MIMLIDYVFFYNFILFLVVVIISKFIIKIIYILYFGMLNFGMLLLDRS